MTLVNPIEEALLAKNAKLVILNLPNIFDSHDFIQQLIKEDEVGYAQVLYGFITPNSSNDIFRRFHSQIGIYLKREETNLGIASIGQVMSKNIKGDVSPNEGWEKQ